MPDPEFDRLEPLVIKAAAEHLAVYAAENPGLLVSQFAFDCNPDYGSLLLCLDTHDNTAAFARENEEDRTRRRKADLSYAVAQDWWTPFSS